MSQVFTVFCTDKSRDTTWIESVEVAGWNANLAIAEGRRRCADAWEQEPEEIIVLGVAAGVVEIPLWDDDGLEDPLPSKGGVRTTQQAFHSMRGHMVDGCEIQMDNGDLLVLKAVHGGWVLTRNGTPPRRTDQFCPCDRVPSVQLPRGHWAVTLQPTEHPS